MVGRKLKKGQIQTSALVSITAHVLKDKPLCHIANYSISLQMTVSQNNSTYYRGEL